MPSTTIGSATPETYGVSVASRLSHTMPTSASERPPASIIPSPIRAAMRGTARTIANIASVIGRNARPASRAPSSRTPCRYCVTKKNMPNMPPTTITRAT